METRSFLSDNVTVISRLSCEFLTTEDVDSTHIYSQIARSMSDLKWMGLMHCSTTDTHQENFMEDHPPHICFIVFYFIFTAFSVLAQVTFLYLSLLKGAKCIHDFVLWAVLRWPALTFDKVPSGRIINRFSTDIEVLDSTLKTNMQQFLWLTAQVSAQILIDNWLSAIVM